MADHYVVGKAYDDHAELADQDREAQAQQRRIVVTVAVEEAHVEAGCKCIFKNRDARTVLPTVLEV